MATAAEVNNIFREINKLSRLHPRGNPEERLKIIEADIRELTLDPANVVTLNWVMQFLPSTDRTPTLVRIHDCLQPDGLLILSEKIRFEDAAEEEFSLSTHLDFKRANGYSELEISNKRSALEQVMVVDTPDDHITRLQSAGFRDVRLWFQCLNWASFVASA